jgi:hypothetical protein
MYLMKDSIQSQVVLRKFVMSTSLGALAQGDKLHRLLIFFSNRAVYAQVLRKVDNHVSSDMFQFLSYLLLKKMTFSPVFCACRLWLRRAQPRKC